MGRPKLADWKDDEVQMVYRILQSKCPKKPNDEHWDGYISRWIVQSMRDKSRKIKHLRS